jgi:hypothetical protein
MTGNFTAMARRRSSSRRETRTTSKAKENHHISLATTIGTSAIKRDTMGEVEMGIEFMLVCIAKAVEATKEGIMNNHARVV